MNKLSIKIGLILAILTISTFSLQTVQAQNSIEFYLNLFNITQNQYDYIAELNLSNKDLSFVLYLYSNSDRSINEDDLEFIKNHRNNLSQLSLYFGMPPIIFEDGLIELHNQNPGRRRLLPTSNRRNFEEKHTGRYEEEIIRRRGNTYTYTYKNSRYNITEKIESKNNKYEYYYSDSNVTEKLKVIFANNKYEYYFKNHRSGEVIRKEGRGQRLDPKTFYKELEQKQIKEEQEKESGFNFNFGFDFKFNF
ncbi:hypothetical protein [Natronospora cellulosivora (SeqCode)]